jgi:hypothetical protein
MYPYYFYQNGYEPCVSREHCKSCGDMEETEDVLFVFFSATPTETEAYYGRHQRTRRRNWRRRWRRRPSPETSAGG